MVPALAVLALASGLAQVHTVDDTPGTGADFATIQAAVDAASDGDTLLIAGGTYAGFVVDGKDLALTFDGAPVTVTTASIVRNVPAGKQVLLRRLYLHTLDSVPLRVEQADGTVWIEECSLVSSHTSGTYHAGSPGLSVADALDVRVIRSLVQGEPGSPEKLLSIYAKPGGAGIAAVDSALSVFDSNAIGGKGGNAWPSKGLLDGADAGAGIALDFSSLRAWGASLQGGDGGNADYCHSCPGGKKCGYAGKGGDGLAVNAPIGPGSIEFLDVTLVPGEGGGQTDWLVDCPEGDPGLAVGGIAFGELVLLSGPNRPFWTFSPAEDGGQAALFLKGQPGDLALIAVGSSAQGLTLPGFVGPLFLGPDLKLVFAGPWSVAVLEPLVATIPPQALGFETVRLFLQGAIVSNLGEVRLLAPASLVVVDDGI